MRRRLILLFVPFFFVGIAMSGVFFAMKQTEENREQVWLSKPAIRGKIVFFFRDDCGDCQKIFFQVFAHSLIHKDVLFVNLNQEKNRRYIHTFDLQSVPTLVRGSKRVVGTKQEQLTKILDH
ncbi:thioredoxin family protein [Enterococcus gilvus]|uniref:thioredoxin family protein n=1 Tax=Enterococcus gilvus TaxID=160453 RepID=UPI0028D7D53F|nr:thioredoxin family protein [Enterococcus gilvus]